MVCYDFFFLVFLCFFFDFLCAVFCAGVVCSCSLIFLSALFAELVDFLE